MSKLFAFGAARADTSLSLAAPASAFAFLSGPVPAYAHVRPTLHATPGMLTQLLVQLDVLCILSRSRAPRPTNLACYTQDATRLLVQFDVLCIVVGLQHKHTSSLVVL